MKADHGAAPSHPEENVLTDPVPTPDPALAAIQAETELVKARASLAEAQTSAALGGLATMAASGIQGQVSLQADAGKGEALLLASKAMLEAARRIAVAVKPKIAGGNVAILADDTGLQLEAYRSFEFKKRVIARTLSTAITEAQAILRAEPIPEAALPAIAPIVAGVANLASHFRSDYDIGGISVDKDDQQLLHSLAGALLEGEKRPKAISLPGVNVPGEPDAWALVQDLLDAADRGRGVVVELQMSAAEAKRRLETAADADKKAIEAELVRTEKAAEALTSAATKAQDFVTALAEPTADGGSPMARIAGQQLIGQALAAAEFLLVVSVRGAAGGYYSVKNLWTSIGFSIPFHVMGGVVVSYRLLDRSGAVLLGTAVPVHGGYGRIDQIKTLLAQKAETGPG